MRCQPNRNYTSDDVVQTPPEMAQRLVNHFQPEGRILEPCCGQGHFLKVMPGAEWCELSKGKDFFDWDRQVDWIITNPPWSKIRPFLAHSMEVADHIVFLMTVNHAWTKARLRDVKESGFGIKAIALLEMPLTFPQSGFQLGAVYYARGWNGNIKFTDLSKPIQRKSRVKTRRSVRPVASKV
ncbi:MAG: hypothetical protein AAF571_02420 [Verrucomicrobiota bacterium]